MNTQARITYIERGSNAPRPDLFRCNLVWENESTLLIGWGNSIKIGKILQRHNSPFPSAVGHTSPHTYTETQQNVPERYVELTALFETDYYVCGIAPFGEFLVVLSVEDDPSDGSERLRPELRIVTRTNEEISSDALSVKGFEKYLASDYRLCHVEAENMFYIVSPKDIVIGRPRDMDDHIAWLLERRKYEEALQATETHADQLREHTLAEVGQSYIEHLLYLSKQAPSETHPDPRQFAKRAAGLCPKVLGKDDKLWEKWVFRFGELNEFRAICDYIPTHKPLILSSTVYEMVLGAFLSSPESSDRSKFLELIQNWPPTLYSVPNVINALKSRLQSVSDTALMDALARLYAFNGDYAKTLHIYLRLKKTKDPNAPSAAASASASDSGSFDPSKPDYQQVVTNSDDAFDLIVRHRLFDAVRDKILLLMEYDSKRASELMVTHIEQIQVEHVVEQLVAAGATVKVDPKQAPIQDQLPVRRWLHEYLHALFLRDPHVGRDFHQLMIDLYADFDREQLLPFLRQSNYYPLEKALEVCQQRELYRETVFLMGRMGNAKNGLQLLIEKIGEVREAISFIEEQNDSELWEDLIEYAMTSPKFVSDLLEHIGAYIDPLQLIKRIPAGMEIQGLRDRLVKIISDFNLQSSLRKDCNRILQSDCADLSLRLFRQQRRGQRVDQFVECALCGGRLVCAKPWSIIAFECHHVYHQRCFLRAAEQSSDGQTPAGGFAASGLSDAQSRQSRSFAMRSSFSLSPAQEEVAMTGRMWCSICQNDASKQQQGSGNSGLSHVATGRRIG
jgi:vacuolar protein sorting-associated protein 41